MQTGKRGAYTVGTQQGREMDICGKCPLELAGYDISQIPIAPILRGQLLGWGRLKPFGSLSQMRNAPVPEVA